MSIVKLPVPKIAEMNPAAGKKLEALIDVEIGHAATARNILVSERERARAAHRYRGAFGGKAVGEVVDVKVAVADDTQSVLRKSDTANTIPHSAPAAEPIHDVEGDEHSKGSERERGSGWG